MWYGCESSSMVLPVASTTIMNPRLWRNNVLEAEFGEVNLYQTGL